MFTQTWNGTKSYGNQNSARSSTPKRTIPTKETEKTPEKVMNDISQLLNYTPSPHFHHRKSPTMSPSLTPRTQRKTTEQTPITERDKKTSYLRESQKHLRNSSSNISSHIKMRNNENDEPHFNATMANQNLENNYMGQINKMIEKISRLKKDVERHQEKEAYYLSKMASLEKENRSLQLLVEDKDKKIQEILRKAKHDKLKMYNFLKEFEAYKERTLEQETRDLRIDNFINSGGDTYRGLEKPTQANRMVQTDDLPPEPCIECETFRTQSEYLMKKMTQLEESSKALLQEYNQMKNELEETRRNNANYIRICNDSEKKFKELQKSFNKQNNINIEVVSENSLIRSALHSLSEEIGCCSSMPSKKDKKQNYSTHPLPACLKAIMFSEKLCSAAAH
jgi:hypothetical protein